MRFNKVQCITLMLLTAAMSNLQAEQVVPPAEVVKKFEALLAAGDLEQALKWSAFSAEERASILKRNKDREPRPYKAMEVVEGKVSSTNPDVAGVLVLSAKKRREKVTCLNKIGGHWKVMMNPSDVDSVKEACSNLRSSMTTAGKKQAAFEAESRIKTSAPAIYVKVAKTELTPDKKIGTTVLTGGCKITVMFQNQLSHPISSSDLKFKIDEIRNSFMPSLGGEVAAGDLVFRSSMIPDTKQCPKKLTLWTVDGKGKGVFVNNSLMTFTPPEMMSATIVDESSLLGS